MVAGLEHGRAGVHEEDGELLDGAVLFFFLGGGGRGLRK